MSRPTQTPLTVAFLPVYPNPYQRQLAAAVSSHGVQVEMIPTMPTSDWLRENAGRVHILHLHWLYGIYMARYHTPLRLFAFLNRLALAQRLGYRIVWTAHNLLPHRTELRPLHNLIRARIMRQADAVIVHCHYGEAELRRRYERHGPISVIPIGNMMELYPLTMTTSEARGALGLPRKSYVYLFLGLLAPYKGIDLLIEAFSRMATVDDVLLIAGPSLSKVVTRQVEAAAKTDARIHLRLEYVPEEEMQQYLLSADVLVAPYRDVLTSSSAVLGLSYGLPVIAPAIGCLPELVPDDAGVLYDPLAAGGLSNAMQTIKLHDPDTMRARALQTAEQLDWGDIGRLTVAVYRSCLKGIDR